MKKEIKDTIAKRIRELRKQHGMTQADLSDRLNLDVPRVSRIESGTRHLMSEDIIKLCEIFNVSADYILFGREYTVNGLTPMQVDALILLLRNLESCRIDNKFC